MFTNTEETTFIVTTPASDSEWTGNLRLHTEQGVKVMSLILPSSSTSSKQEVPVTETFNKSEFAWCSDKICSTWIQIEGNQVEMSDDLMNDEDDDEDDYEDYKSEIDPKKS